MSSRRKHIENLPELCDLIMTVSVKSPSILADSKCPKCAGNGVVDGDDYDCCDCVYKYVAVEIVEYLTEQLEEQYGQRICACSQRV